MGREHGVSDDFLFGALLSNIFWYILHILKLTKVTLRFIILCLLSNKSPLFKTWLKLEAWKTCLYNLDLIAIYLESCCYHCLILNWIQRACGITNLSTNFCHLQTFL